MCLPDINVWLALTFSSHLHHNPARSWFAARSVNRPSHFCRYTQAGFLRLANNPSVFPQAAVTQDQAWRLYDAMTADPRVAFAVEPSALEMRWRQFAQFPRFSPNVWNDAYLAAFAVVGNYELVTFDKAFAQYVGLAVTIL